MSGLVQTRPRILLTVEVEDYFQVGSFERLIEREQWYRFETRIERNTRQALDLIEEFDIRATFFVLGWVADKLPELVQQIVKRGHEVASSGFYHRTIRDMGPSEFRDDLQRSRESLERASGRRVIGHRVPHFIGPDDLWVLDVLAQEGYSYDSSIRPLFRQFAGEPWRRSKHEHEASGRRLWEFPLSSTQVLGLSVPIAGGNYFRQFPHAAVKRAVRRWQRRHQDPFVMYFHVWELDPDQPRINTSSFLTRIRHYRNLDKMGRIVKEYFRESEVTGIADYLGESTEGPGRHTARTPAIPEAAMVSIATEPAGPAVSIVIPCYNEEQSLSYLSNTLRSLESDLGRRHDLTFIFVDDGSSDGTWALLGRLFGGNPRASLIRHEKNSGVAAAILTGIRASKSEIVCSIDCDCTYDPHELGNMVGLLVEGVDMVTASPYHPDGRVRNVPPWRLTLSRGASFLYRRILRNKLATYTSCFRVYRRSALVRLHLEEGGFLGVTEMLGKLDLTGARIVEHPATLEVRIFGQSKMKVARAVAGHLRLLMRLASLRLFGNSDVTPVLVGEKSAGATDPITRGQRDVP
jgi:polysaccharide deacetylase family protein (PEP-CTERM system associated)